MEPIHNITDSFKLLKDRGVLSRVIIFVYCHGVLMIGSRYPHCAGQECPYLDSSQVFMSNIHSTQPLYNIQDVLAQKPSSTVYYRLYS